MGRYDVLSGVTDVKPRSITVRGGKEGRNDHVENRI